MKRLFLCFALLAAVCFVACNEDDSAVGLGLQDPATLYEGIADTLYGTAYTVCDDSMLASGYSQGLIGHTDDAVFGHTEAMVYAQVANTAETAIDWSISDIDSAFLSLSVQTPYPNSLTAEENLRLHFEVRQVAEDILKDSSYYSSDSVRVSNTKFFDGTVEMNPSDTVVRMRLNDNFLNILRGHNYSNDELLSAIKGIRIRIIDEGTPVMLTLNFNGAQTGVTVYRTYRGSIDTTQLENILAIGSGGNHFNRFVHKYSASSPMYRFMTNRKDSIDGAEKLYLEPMGGTRIKLNFDKAIKKFHKEHPNAIIHYAEIRVPLASSADAFPPEQLMPVRIDANGRNLSIPDMMDSYTMGTLDYKYNATTNAYHLRITQYLQSLLRSNADYGTYLVINSRRASANRTIVNGYNASDPIRIVVVYTEL